MKRLIYKLLVGITSLVLVACVLGTVFYIRDSKQKKETVAEQEQEADSEETASEETAKAAMTESQIQALYKEHKKEAGEEDVPAENVESGAEEEESSEEIPTQEEPEESPVDWEGITAVNPDVYAWITIPGTEIDYPILQHATDNTYYLNYNIDGSYGYPGCIYTENMNAKDFSDNNTVIYGHNMKNGTMFAGLHAYKDSSFFDEHRSILIYTPDKTYEYTVFAAYVYDDRHLLYSFDFANEDVYAAYLDNILNLRDLSANIRNDLAVTSKDKIITLATCISDQPDKRLLVQAVRNE